MVHCSMSRRQSFFLLLFLILDTYERCKHRSTISILLLDLFLFYDLSTKFYNIQEFIIPDHLTIG